VAASKLAAEVAAASAAAVAARGAFSIVLTGGSLISALGALRSMKDVAFDKWHVFYGDERNVPHASADSNHGGAVAQLLSKVRSRSVR
jgi:6-phosphogluconolactonase